MKTSTFFLGLLLFGFNCALRWYQLPQHLFFGFEQGRDAQRVVALINREDLFLVGPKTDIDGIFHGAWYYYLMAVPYGVSSGDPLVAAAFLVILSSFTPLILWWLLETMTGQRKVGVLAAILAVVSFELITYSRWLSNVTPAVPLLTLAYALLWQYRRTQQPWWWVSAVSLGYLAAQFQIILTLWWSFALMVLLVTKTLPWPRWPWLMLSAVTGGFWYLPWLAFNVKYDFISVKSAMAYFSKSEGEGWHFSLLSSIQTYLKMIWTTAWKSLFNFPEHKVVSALGWAMVLIGLGAVWRQRPTLHPALKFLATWSFMSLPVLAFSDSLQLDQLYIGTGVGLIGLATLSLWQLSQTSSWWAKASLVSITVLLVISLGITSWRLHHNQGMYFITIQEGLNLAEQRRVLGYVLAHPAGQQYRFQAFTIPYYQEEGWQYLHAWLRTKHNPSSLASVDAGASTIYLVIEAQVDPYWEQQWIKDLGPTQLLEEQMFGKLRVQRRVRVEAQ